MKTTLEIFHKFAGHQGGTIHQALQLFNSWGIHAKDSFCSEVMRKMDAGLLSDPENFVLFTRARINMAANVVASL